MAEALERYRDLRRDLDELLSTERRRILRELVKDLVFDRYPGAREVLFNVYDDGRRAVVDVLDESAAVDHLQDALDAAFWDLLDCEPRGIWRVTRTGLSPPS